MAKLLSSSSLCYMFHLSLKKEKVAKLLVQNWSTIRIYLGKLLIFCWTQLVNYIYRFHISSSTRGKFLRWLASDGLWPFLKIFFAPDLLAVMMMMIKLTTHIHLASLEFRLFHFAFFKSSHPISLWVKVALGNQVSRKVTTTTTG